MAKGTHLILLGLALAWLILFARPFYQLFVMATKSNAHTHILMVPFFSAYIFWLARKRIFSNVDKSAGAGFIFIIVGFGILMVGQMFEGRLNQNDFLFFTTFSGLAYLMGLFIWFFGKKVFKNAAFPLLFLYFMVPIPSIVLNSLIVFLQTGSADMSESLFHLFGIPVFREGMQFSLTRITIEVAEQCSGIRSAITLVILSVLISYMYLNSLIARTTLVLAVIPITIFKNALRIVMLAYLGSYVDMAYLRDSAVHSNGGVPFLFLAILFLLPVLGVLRTIERKFTRKPSTN